MKLMTVSPLEDLLDTDQQAMDLTDEDLALVTGAGDDDDSDSEGDDDEKKKHDDD